MFFLVFFIFSRFLEISVFFFENGIAKFGCVRCGKWKLLDTFKSIMEEDRYVFFFKKRDRFPFFFL
jgi:hypothetical protein